MRKIFLRMKLFDCVDNLEKSLISLLISPVRKENFNEVQFSRNKKNYNNFN